MKTAIGSVMKVLEPFTKMVGGAIKGIGPATAAKIVEQAKTDVSDSYPVVNGIIEEYRDNR